MEQQVSEYISNNVAGLTLGTNLYAGFTPVDAPDDCVTVFNRVGARADYKART